MIKPYYQDNSTMIYCGHILGVLSGMEAESVQCIVTSPPYWGLRDYGLEPQVWLPHKAGCLKETHEWGDETIKEQTPQRDHDKGTRGQEPNRAGAAFKASQGQFCLKCNAWRGSLGLEPTPDLYVQHLVEIFREVRRVLRKDGTLWLNLGDSYEGSGSPGGDFKKGKGGDEYLRPYNRGKNIGLKPKDLCMMPARVALALQADGWWLRSDIIWSKPNPMPESVTDRPTRSHEYVFLLTKSKKYYYDAEAVKEPQTGTAHSKGKKLHPPIEDAGIGHKDWHKYTPAVDVGGRNHRSVWTIATQPYPDAHFATFPEKLVEPCILAGTSEKGCCPECGALWERVIDYKANYTKREPAHAPKSTPSKVDSSGWKEPTIKTLGWWPVCKCYDDRYRTEFPKARKARKRDQRDSWGDWWRRVRRRPGKAHWGTIPCVTLDIFGGSGVVGVVAKKLGRKSILIDLKEEYCEMMIKRIPKQEVLALNT